MCACSLLALLWGWELEVGKCADRSIEDEKEEQMTVKVMAHLMLNDLSPE